MSETATTDIDPEKIIYYMEEGQKLLLEKNINNSLVQLEKLFQKEEILKFLYKYILEGKINFEEEIKSEGKEVTEEEIALKQDNFCRELKKIFDQIKPDIFSKYCNRIANAVIKILKTIYKRWKITSNKIREVKIKLIEEDCEENKKKYENLDALKSIIQETIYISSNYISELNNADNFLSQNLDDFYEEKKDIELINVINGEEKRAKADEIIQKVVNIKEDTGKNFVVQNKIMINEIIEEQNKLDKKMNNMINELEDLKEQKLMFEKYCDEESIFKEINEVDFYA